MPKINRISKTFGILNPTIIVFLGQFLDKRLWRIILFTLATSATYAVLAAVIPYFAKLQIDQLEQPTQAVYDLPFQPLTLFIAFLLAPAILLVMQQAVSQLVESYLLSRFDFRVQEAVREHIWNKLYTFDQGFWDSERNQFLFSQAMDASRVVSDVFTFARNNFEIIITFLTIVPLLGLVSWQLLAIILISAVIQFYLRSRQFEKESVDSLELAYLRRETERVEMILSRQFPVLKQFGELDSFLQQRFKNHKKEHEISLQQSQQRQQSRIWQQTIQEIFLVAANIFVGYQVLNGRLSLGSFALTLAYTTQINNLFLRTTNAYQRLRTIDLDFFRLKHFLDLSSRWQEGSGEKKIRSPKKLSMNAVSFSYPNYYQEEKAYLEQLKTRFQHMSETGRGGYFARHSLQQVERLINEQHESVTVLNDVSLSLQRGAVVALLGRNGAGKSTIIRLLTHAYEPDSGSVELDGKPLYSFDHDSVMKQLGLLAQDPVVLPRFSLRENLALGVHRSLKESEYWQALEKVGLKSFVHTLPKQLETVVGEDTQLSGGQRQLIALARVFLQKRAFIFLDEGSSHLDVEKEQRILNELIALAHQDNVGVLFVTHRITTARKADVLYVVDEGKIVESGTHESLLAANGLYAHFWQTQVVV